MTDPFADIDYRTHNCPRAPSRSRRSVTTGASSPPRTSSPPSTNRLPPTRWPPHNASATTPQPPGNGKGSTASTRRKPDGYC